MENTTALQELYLALENSRPEQWYDILRLDKKRLLKKDKQQMIDFHVEVMKRGLINEGEKQWKDAYHPRIRKIATKYYKETYKK